MSDQNNATPSVHAQIITSKFILNSDDLTPHERLLLFVLSAHIGLNSYGWPKIELLSKECGLCQRTIKTCIKSLEARNLIKVVRSPDKVNGYYLTLPTMPDVSCEPGAFLAPALPKKRQPGANRAPEKPEPSANGAQTKCTPCTSTFNNKTNNKKENDSLSFCQTENIINFPISEINVYDTVWHHWVKVMRVDSPILTESRYECVKQAVELNGIDKCIWAIDGCKSSQWHIDNGYGEITSILKNPETIEKHIARKKAAGSCGQTTAKSSSYGKQEPKAPEPVIDKWAALNRYTANTDDRKADPRNIKIHEPEPEKRGFAEIMKDLTAKATAHLEPMQQ